MLTNVDTRDEEERNKAWSDFQRASELMKSRIEANDNKPENRVKIRQYFKQVYVDTLGKKALKQRAFFEEQLHNWRQFRSRTLYMIDLFTSMERLFISDEDERKFLDSLDPSYDSRFPLTFETNLKRNWQEKAITLQLLKNIGNDDYENAFLLLAVNLTKNETLEFAGVPKVFLYEIWEKNKREEQERELY